MNTQKKREIMDGILLIDKPKSITSRDVVDAIMKKFETKKVGHTGTLDPFATGLMMITLGKGTKLGPFIENLFKVYTATIQLGKKTTTGDLMGEVTATSDIIDMYDQFILDTLESFIGKQMQLPPMDIHPLPKIVKEALKNPQEEIETFSIVQQKSKDDDKMTADFLLGKEKPRRGGKTKHY
jgi:tRNA pseudouridine55 synthase